jgi:curved DNA-binding protein CbpA
MGEFTKLIIMEFVRDRRLFKRYKHQADFYIIVEGNYYKASTIDFSLSGLCIFIEGLSSLTVNSVIGIKIEDMDLDIQARVVWIKKTDSNLIVGFEKMSFIGLLKFYPLTDILLDLQRSDLTGALEFKNDSINKKIFIKNGVMVFATSNQEEDRLEEILLRTGKITSDQYYQSIEIMKKEGKPQGRVLIELGYLKPKELVWSVRHHAEEIILSLFRWEDGSVSFAEGSLPGDMISLKLSAANLIFQGIKRINKSDYFKNICPTLDTILYYSPDPLNLFQDISLPETDKDILSLIDGNLTIKEILSISSHGAFPTTKTLCALLSTRMIEIKGKGVLEDKGIVEIIKEPKKDVDPAFVKKVDDLYNRYQSMDYYSILGIERNVTLSTIRKAYYKSAKEFHPDRHFHIESETIRNKLTALFSYITDVFRTLSDPEERKKYDQSLKTTASYTKSSNIEKARIKFEEGKAAFKKGLFQDAAELFGQAIYLDNSIPAYHFSLARAYWKQKKLREAEMAMSKALKIDPYNAEYLSELGHIYMELGLKLRAKSIFEKTIKFDPYNKRALEGLKKI